MKEIYSWVPWFRELARKIAEGGEAYLIEKARQVEWGGDPPLLRYGDEGIDPFSFFYFLASKNTSNQLETVYDSVSDVFDIESSLPDTDNGVYYIFPTPQSNAHLLFHEQKNFTPDSLWRLFKETVKDNPKIGPDDFKNALEIKYTGVRKLTQTLFLINPEYFLPVDNSTEVLSEVLGLPVPSEVENEIKDGGYGQYLSVMETLKKAFPECQPYEINMFLYLQKSEQIINANSEFFQISTKVYDDENDYWDDFKENNWVYTGGWGINGNYPLRVPKRGDIILVRTGLKKGRAIGIVLKNDYKSGYKEYHKIHVLWINKSGRDLSQHSMKQQRGFSKTTTSGMYSVFKKTDGYKPSFDLIERLIGSYSANDSETELDNQQMGVNTMKYPLNQILYGPPGTGKTWNTVNHAVAIIEDRPLDEIEKDKDARQRFRDLKKDGQIAMVTFHQNFTYEDFIEGIKPILDDDGNGNIEYELSRGIFRDIVERAKKNRMQWDIDELLQDFAMSIEARLKSKEKINLFSSNDKSDATIKGISWKKDGNFQSVQLGGFQGPRTLSKDIIERDYEAFHKGEIESSKDIKPVRKSTLTLHGNAMYYFPLFEIIKKFHDEEWQPKEPVKEQNKEQNYVLIIDEINRGNIAKIFGELITLVEPSKRIGEDDAATVTLPYSQEEFGVPNNLYIIGTMNTADRSIAPLDTALRRRFDFVEMMPDSKHDRISTDIEGVNCQKLLDAMNKRIHFLFDREHQIGHTYFMGVDDLESLAATFKNKIIPLLQEYFYDNWEKIDLVLNRNGFIVPQSAIDSNLFKNSDLIEERKIYELSDDGKWTNPEIYKAIYAQGQGETPEAE